MTAPVVSVIVSVFNSQRYLNECAESLRAQTLHNFEVILADPGSHDQTAEICRRLAASDSRFRYLPVAGSTLVSFCRAKAVEAASAPLIAILDSDDRAMPTRLQRQSDWMRDHPDVVLSGTYYRVINENGWIVRLSPLKITEDIEIRWRLLFGNCLTHSTVMFRKEAAERSGNYDPRIRAGEDVEFFSRMLGQGRLAVIPEVLGSWRVHRRSLSRTESTDFKIDFLTTVQNSIQNQLDEHVSVEVAAALYNQSPSPAASLAVFEQALAFVELADRGLRKRFALTPDQSRRLSRSIFLQLLQLMSRNSSEDWWPETKPRWSELTRRLTVGRDGYTWYRDSGLLPYYKSLLKSDKRFLLMKELY